MLRAHPAIEELHPQRLLRPGPAGERLARAQEVRVDPHVERTAGRRRDALDRLQHPPFARLRDDQRRGALRVEHRVQPFGEVAGHVVVDAHVDERDAARREPGGEVAHRRQEDRDARLRRPDDGALARGLDHDDRVDGRIEAGERAAVDVELIAEDEPKRGRSISPSGKAPVTLGRRVPHLLRLPLDGSFVAPAHRSPRSWSCDRPVGRTRRHAATRGVRAPHDPAARSLFPMRAGRRTRRPRDGRHSAPGGPASGPCEHVVPRRGRRANRAAPVVAAARPPVRRAPPRRNRSVRTCVSAR